jgi:hypothetical protein
LTIDRSPYYVLMKCTPFARDIHQHTQQDS